MRFALWLLACGLALGVLLSACGSGGRDAEGEQSVSTGTVRSERVERDASIIQEEAQREQTAAETGRIPEQVGDGEPGGAEQVDAGVEQGGVIDFGHREGLPFTRNVVGDPEAPVLIVEYSDFQ